MAIIPFNKPYLTGKEAHYIYQAVSSGKISGNGVFTQRCQRYFEERYGFKKCLLTTSCTDALEMAAILCCLEPGDEVIIPSYTFVSTAIAFIREGARVIFADSGKDNPNLDVDLLESLITPRTKVIVPVHYAGVACDMDRIMEIAEKHQLIVVEDAAQAVDSFYKGKPLGSIGHMSAFSFHETKNIIAGEAGMIAINDERFCKRAEIIWEKGTNRSEFFRGEVNKYGWVDIGSSFLPSEVISAFLHAQIENIDDIQTKRKHLWSTYHQSFRSLLDQGKIAQLPCIPEYATNNAHMYYIVCHDLEQRSALIAHLKADGILAVFHYLSLHKSDYYAPQYTGKELPEADRYTNTLVRLPLFYELSDEQQTTVIHSVLSFFKDKC